MDTGHDWGLGPDGPRRAGAGADVGRPFGLGLIRLDRICIFRIYFENNSRKSRNCFKDMKNTRKIPNISEKIAETNSDMNNPNKVFGAHENDFRAF
jgi:hypothetical protein